MRSNFDRQIQDLINALQRVQEFSQQEKQKLDGLVYGKVVNLTLCLQSAISIRDIYQPIQIRDDSNCFNKENQVYVDDESVKIKPDTARFFDEDHMKYEKQRGHEYTLRNSSDSTIDRIFVEDGFTQVEDEDVDLAGMVLKMHSDDHLMDENDKFTTVYEFDLNREMNADISVFDVRHQYNFNNPLHDIVEIEQSTTSNDYGWKTVSQGVRNYQNCQCETCQSGITVSNRFQVLSDNDSEV